MGTDEYLLSGIDYHDTAVKKSLIYGCVVYCCVCLCHAYRRPP